MAIWLALTAFTVAALTTAVPAGAHVVYGTPSLHDLARDADLVVRARITAARPNTDLPETRAGRPVVEAVVLETLHGEPVRRVTFAAHGHGPAEYHNGEEALIFLGRLDRVPELAATPLQGRVEWVSVQETTDKIPLSPRTRAAWVEAARGYLRVEAMADPAGRRAALRDTTLTLLASPEPRLAASALRDLVGAGGGLPLTPADVPRLEALLDRDAVPIAVRMGVLAELEHRGLIAAPRRWAGFVARARRADLVAVVRAVAAHPSPEVTAALVRVLKTAAPDAVAAAAVSLGTPANGDAVAPLTRLLARDDVRLRFAAIRGLGGIGTAEALESLRTAAATHPDAETRRRARAEVTIIDRQG